MTLRVTLEYARHGRSLGGESPLEEEVVLTPSRRQLRRREAGWEWSVPAFVDTGLGCQLAKFPVS